MSVKVINEADFEKEVLKSDVPVLVDFFAEWCGPCQLMAPIIESISEEIGDKVKFVKVNTDENMELSMQYRVMSIPTILVFKRGEIKSTFVGVTDKEELMNALV